MDSALGNTPQEPIETPDYLADLHEAQCAHGQALLDLDRMTAERDRLAALLDLQRDANARQAERLTRLVAELSELRRRFIESVPHDHSEATSSRPSGNCRRCALVREMAGDPS